MIMPEMESMASDATNQPVESSSSESRPVVEQRLGVDPSDANIGRLENVPDVIAVDFKADDTVGPIEDTKDAVEQPASINAPLASDGHLNAGDAVGPIEDTKDAVEQAASINVPPAGDVHLNAGDTVGPIEDKKDAGQPVSVVMDKLDDLSGSTADTLVRNDELQKGEASQPDSTSIMHVDDPSRTSGQSWYLGYGLEIGDMVWGRVKSHPWWPGHIFNEAFASSSVKRTKKEGHVLVAFFGDGSYGWFDRAELIPYEPHFLEKSQQSTSKNFLKAVEESVDEACRRSALGLTCFCRNPYNFRPTNVPRHMAVDVSDFEAGAIYSANQIQKGRDYFHPERTLSFIEQLAAAPKKASTSLDFVRQKTAALAYRRAVFEEFDETYAQAFGQPVVRPVVAPPPSVDQSIRAQLSGPLRIAESPSGRKSSTKANKSKEQTKRDKNQLKQRDESGGTVSTQGGEGHSSSSSSAASEIQFSHSEAGDFVLQKRVQAVDQQDSLSIPAKDQMAASSKPSMAQDQSDPSTVKSQKAGVLKGKLKRPDHEKSELREKKKKKKRASDSPGNPDLQKHAPQTIAPSQVDSLPKGIINTSSESEQVPSAPIMSNEENKSELNRVLADLKILALNPSHGKEQNRPVIVRKMFLKFRSLVFQKSLTMPPLSTSNGKEANPAPPSRPPKPLGRTEDPTKGLKKRVPSERQDDLSTKKAKKVSAVKSATEKTKAGHETQQQIHRTGVKMQQPNKARVEEATFLVMKYPPGTSLPSSAELKARFARFGPMDTSQNRVFYTTNTCRIMFLFKEDAENAHKFALRNKSAFANVRFTLRPQSAPSDSQATTATDNNIQQNPAVQLKSCLKKAPAGDESGTQGARGARVRFNIGEPTGSGGGSYSSSSSSLCVANAMDSSSSHKNEQQKAFSSHPPFVSDPRNNAEAPPSRSHSQNHIYATKLPPPPPSPPRPPPPPVVDISQQMMRLLTRCNDVVTNVQSVLGYVPYRPL